MRALPRSRSDRPQATGWQRAALGALAWLAGWAALLLLDGRVDLANLAMVLVLACAVATLWLPVAASLMCSTVSALAFNWLFVPPRYAFTVELGQHALLLVATLAVSWIVAGVMALQRATAERARRHAAEADQTTRWRSRARGCRSERNRAAGPATQRARRVPPRQPGAPMSMSIDNPNDNQPPSEPSPDSEVPVSAEQEEKMEAQMVKEAGPAPAA